MKILIFGLPGSGKTTLAEPLAKLLGGVHINADEVRKKYEGHDMSKWDFSEQGRLKQAFALHFGAQIVPYRLANRAPGDIIKDV